VPAELEEAMKDQQAGDDGASGRYRQLHQGSRCPPEAGPRLFEALRPEVEAVLRQ